MTVVLKNPISNWDFSVIYVLSSMNTWQLANANRAEQM